jgi:hypothetical protein
MAKHAKQSAVKAHSRKVRGRTQKVRAHSRKHEWSDAKTAVVVAGAAGTVFVGTAMELGFKVATLVLLLLLGVITAFLGRNRKALVPTRRGGKRRQTRGAFTCRRCRGKYTNAFNHRCQVRWSQMKKQRPVSKQSS